MLENMERIIVSDSDQLAEKGAEIFYKTAKETFSRQSRFIIAVSGGSTPRAMHRRLSQEPCLSGISWEKTHLFWVDERMVPFDHPASNFGTAQKDFIDKIPIPSDQVYPMPAMASPEAGASLYQAKLKRFFQRIGRNDPVFDLIFLGMGQDGHIASLFPEYVSIPPSQSWVISVKGGDPNVFRLTLTYPVLNSARHICFLVSGKGKAPMVKTLFENPHAHIPAGRIKPLNGKVTWLLDQEAASLISETYLGRIRSEK